MRSSDYLICVKYQKLILCAPFFKYMERLIKQHLKKYKIDKSSLIDKVKMQILSPIDNFPNFGEFLQNFSTFP